MTFEEALAWCIHHNAHVRFTHELTVQVNVQQFEYFFEGNNFLEAVVTASTALTQAEAV